MSSTAPGAKDSAAHSDEGELGVAATLHDTSLKEQDSEGSVSVRGDPPAPPTPRAPRPGERFGRFIVGETLGRGGMGTVIKARDDRLDRELALKLLHPDLSGRSATRLLREAQALAKLSHPNVVHVYEVGDVGGQMYIAMELVEGQTLRDWHQTRPSWRECVQVYVQAGRGLAAAHAQGLVHRDFKPSNAILDTTGRVRVLDFGLARELDVSASAGSHDDPEPEFQPPPVAFAMPSESMSNALKTSLTQTGAVMGTLAYMPPEQLWGRRVTARSDQFSFCSSLYEAVYGQRPYADDTAMRLSLSLTEGVVRPAPSGSKVPVRLRRALVRGLSVPPSERWPSLDDLLQELSAIVEVRRRRWGGAIIIMGTGLAVMGVGLWQQAAVGQRCGGAADRMAETWNDARREALETAILGTERPYARDTLERVTPALDQYARDWQQRYTANCEATRVQEEQTEAVMALRSACLGNRRMALREAIDVLAHADPKVVEQGVDLVAGLPRLDRCDDVEALQAEIPPPEDDHAAQQVEQLRTRLLRSNVHLQVGQYDEARQELEEALEQAQALGYAPLVAEAELERGRVALHQQRYAEAEQALVQAFELAVEHGHDEAAIDAANRLLIVVGSHLSRHAEGRQWGRVAQAFARRNPRGFVEAGILDNLSVVLREQGALEEALERQQQALAIRERSLEHDRIGIARSRAHLGLVLRDKGRGAEGLAQQQQALALFVEALGDKHPNVAQVLTNLGVTLEEQGELDDAVTHLRRALAIFDALPDQSLNVAQVRVNLGVMLMKRGDLAEAEDSMSRGLAIIEDALGPDHPAVASVLTNLGAVMLRQGDLEESTAQLTRALTIKRRALGGRHASVAATLVQLGETARAQGKLEPALGYATEALQVYEAALGKEHPSFANALVGLADVELARGRVEVASGYAQRAIEIHTRAGHEPVMLAPARFVLARARWAQGVDGRAEARAIAEDVVKVYREAGGRNAALAETQAWLDAHDVEP